MSENFKVEAYKINGSLQVKLAGDFDGSSAWELINAIMMTDNGKGSIVIDTDRLGRIIPFGRLMLGHLIKTNSIAMDRIEIKGKKRKQIGLNGCGTETPETPVCGSKLANQEVL